MIGDAVLEPAIILHLFKKVSKSARSTALSKQTVWSGIPKISRASVSISRDHSSAGARSTGAYNIAMSISFASWGRLQDRTKENSLLDHSFCLCQLPCHPNPYACPVMFFLIETA